MSGAQPRYPAFLLLVVFAAGVAALDGSLEHPAWPWLLSINTFVAVVVSCRILRGGSSVGRQCPT